MAVNGWGLHVSMTSMSRPTRRTIVEDVSLSATRMPES